MLVSSPHTSTVIPANYGKKISLNSIYGFFIARACPHLKNGDKNEINCSQTRKVAQIISGY